jgi:hypothetical protein
MILDYSGGDRRVAVMCLTLITSKPRHTSTSEISYAWVFCGKRRITALKLIGFGEKGVVYQVLAVEVEYYGFEIHHASRDDPCSLSFAIHSGFFVV